MQSNVPHSDKMKQVKFRPNPTFRVEGEMGPCRRGLAAQTEETDPASVLAKLLVYLFAYTCTALLDTEKYPPPIRLNRSPVVNSESISDRQVRHHFCL